MRHLASTLIAIALLAPSSAFAAVNSATMTIATPAPRSTVGDGSRMMLGSIRINSAARVNIRTLYVELNAEPVRGQFLDPSLHSIVESLQLKNVSTGRRIPGVEGEGVLTGKKQSIVYVFNDFTTNNDTWQIQLDLRSRKTPLNIRTRFFGSESKSEWKARAEDLESGDPIVLKPELLEMRWTKVRK